MGKMPNSILPTFADSAVCQANLCNQPRLVPKTFNVSLLLKGRI